MHMVRVWAILVLGAQHAGRGALADVTNIFQSNSTVHDVDHHKQSSQTASTDQQLEEQK